MNEVLATICVALFFLVAPVLVAAKYYHPTRISWRVIIVGAAFLGWGLINLDVYFTQAHTVELVERAGGLDRAPPELLEKWSRDGSPKVFALLLGWVTGLVYLLPWAGIYAICDRIRGPRVAA